MGEGERAPVGACMCYVCVCVCVCVRACVRACVRVCVCVYGDWLGASGSIYYFILFVAICLLFGFLDLYVFV